MAATQEALEAMRTLGVARNALDAVTAAFAGELGYAMAATRPYCPQRRLIRGTGDAQEF